MPIYYRVLFLTGFIAGIFFVGTVYAGTLSCAVQNSSCTGDKPIEIFQMYNTTNAHAALHGQGYAYRVCCGGVDGLGNLCFGTFEPVLKLSSTTNAHVRQGTLADYSTPNATTTCISVPGGGSVSVGYQATNCAGFDTILGSMIGTTNSHVGDGNWAAGTTKICASAHGAGTVSADILDAEDNPVTNPSIAMELKPFSFAVQTTNGTFGVSDQKIRVTSTLLDPKWSLSLAATDGSTAVWYSTQGDYEYNDPTTDPNILKGQMTVDPLDVTIIPGPGCTITGLTPGNSESYSKDITDVITLLSAGASADTNCYWDITSVDISQKIPKEQTAADDYHINMTMTVATN